MTGRMPKMLGPASLVIGLLASVASTQAQPSRQWIDPPAEAASPSQGTSQPGHGAAAKEAASQSQRSLPQATSTIPPAPGQTQSRVGGAPSPTAQKSTSGTVQTQRKAPAARTSNASVTSKSKAQQAARTATRRQEATVTGSLAPSQSERRRWAERRGRSRPYETVQDAVDMGLKVMNLRTIELPDGRRISVLVEPDPEMMQGLLDRPYR
jgi:hypothetical protein